MREPSWKRIGSAYAGSPYFIHAAIAIGGDRLLELVKEAIQTWPEGEESPFKHLTMHLHIHFDDEARFVDQRSSSGCSRTFRVWRSSTLSGSGRLVVVGGSLLGGGSTWPR